MMMEEMQKREIAKMKAQMAKNKNPWDVEFDEGAAAGEADTMGGAGVPGGAQTYNY
jgi:hypothetical protein